MANNTLLDFDRTVAAGTTETEAFLIGSDSAVAQIEVSGATTDTDVHIEATLADDVGYRDWISPRTTLAGGDGELVGIDTESVRQLRVRVVNNDGTNDGTVRVVVES